jgi:hypothetical protein
LLVRTFWLKTSTNVPYKSSYKHVAIFCKQVLHIEVEVTLRLMVSQSVSMSRCRAPCGTCNQTVLSVRKLLPESCCLVSVGRPLWREVGSVICHSQSVVIYQYSHQTFTLHVFHISAMYRICTKLLSVPSRYSRLRSTSYY